MSRGPGEEKGMQERKQQDLVAAVPVHPGMHGKMRVKVSLWFLD